MSLRYLDVAEVIMAEIKAGHDPVGSFLPSELMLAKKYGVSRSTVRAALSHLQGLGIISRRRGSGTRIEASEPAPIYVHSMVASGDQLQFAGPTRREVQLLEDIVADESLACRLDNRPGRRWLRIGQTRHVENSDVPVCWTDVYVDHAYSDIRDSIKTYPGLVYTLIEERYGIVISRIDQSLRAVGLPEEYSEILQAPADSHALELTRRYRNASLTCELIAISYLPSGRYSYDLTLSRVSQPANMQGVRQASPD
ncbi:GntR family transcriptional regulator [Telmatospirillum sp. J64-1]|uniref:GntR family transcriptional regulator n=1 Tax=Telmatospirillum sp. J64-1 TaxID=2502183 RepID=UPI00163DCE09|nr:GntR family transcriptional regulator [Telmatospirillum sp. J64-1]